MVCCFGCFHIQWNHPKQNVLKIWKTVFFSLSCGRLNVYLTFYCPAGVHPNHSYVDHQLTCRWHSMRYESVPRSYDVTFQVNAPDFSVALLWHRELSILVSLCELHTTTIYLFHDENGDTECRLMRHWRWMSVNQEKERHILLRTISIC